MVNPARPRHRARHARGVSFSGAARGDGVVLPRAGRRRLVRIRGRDARVLFPRGVRLGRLVRLGSSSSSEDAEEEPILKYRRLGGCVPELLSSDLATCACAAEGVVALGTESGRVHVLDADGVEIAVSPCTPAPSTTSASTRAPSSSPAAPRTAPSPSTACASTSASSASTPPRSVPSPSTPTSPRGARDDRARMRRRRARARRANRRGTTRRSHPARG